MSFRTFTRFLNTLFSACFFTLDHGMSTKKYASACYSWNQRNLSSLNGTESRGMQSKESFWLLDGSFYALGERLIKSCHHRELSVNYRRPEGAPEDLLPTVETRFTARRAAFRGADIVLSFVSNSRFRFHRFRIKYRCISVLFSAAGMRGYSR